MKTFLELLQCTLNIKRTDYFNINSDKDLWKEYFDNINKCSTNEKDNSNMIPFDSIDTTLNSSVVKQIERNRKIEKKNIQVNTNFINYYFVYSLFSTYLKNIYNIKKKQKNYEVSLKTNYNFKKFTECKHKTYHEIIYNNFLPTSTIESVKQSFLDAQRHYLALVRFANIVRHKCNVEKNNTNLQLDIIEPNNKYSIYIYHSSALYLFSLSDLINIITSSVTNHSDDLFSRPTFPKNPYNNITFTVTNLYNIYFKIKSVYLIVPKWVQLFYEADFIIKKFELLNEIALKEKSIRKFVLNSSEHTLYDDIVYMLRDYNDYFHNIRISKRFPRKLFIDIFRPYLYLFYINEYFLEGSDIRYNAKRLLSEKLLAFTRYNTNFGKKIITVKTINIDSFENIFSHTGDNSLSVLKLVKRKKFKITTQYNKLHPNFTLDDAYSGIYNIRQQKCQTIILPPNAQFTTPEEHETMNEDYKDDCDTDSFIDLGIYNNNNDEYEYDSDDDIFNSEAEFTL